ncbi:MAG: hypothetical protein EP330_04315 [Deltaproteobacteria bacterium]|nr:MAG: hypothetical protein EP330_04315 [Deltaproteobacteria bacterium]
MSRGLLLLLVGCGSAEPLVDATLWRPTSDEPLDHRPERDDCPPAAWGAEDGAFEVQTGVCAYGAFAQPALIDVSERQALDVLLWHDDLDAPEPASAHVALWAGDAVLWEAMIAIPSAAESTALTVELDEPIAAGDPVGLHLHNHGYNSWSLARIDVLP